MRPPWTCCLDCTRANAYRLWTAILPRGWDSIIGITIAVITGLYAGAIVARMARFSALKNEALRLARGIDTMPAERALGQIQQRTFNSRSYHPIYTTWDTVERAMF
jgi:hypothetical protein